MDLILDPRSEVEAEQSFEEFRLQLIQSVREGMQEGMEGLAWRLIDRMFGNPVQSRSGALVGAIQGSVAVQVNGDLVRGSLSTNVNGKPIGLWLEFGTHVRQVIGKLFGFYEGGDLLFARGHKAFDVPGKNFINPTLQEYQSTLMGIIAAHIRENAVAAV